jgi:low temperature requirement protein LtrA
MAVQVQAPTTGSRASWFEVLYDLILVAAVLHGSSLFEQDPSLAKGTWLAVTLLVLLTMWLLTTLTFNTTPEDWTLRRLLFPSLARLASAIRRVCLPWAWRSRRSQCSTS